MSTIRRIIETEEAKCTGCGDCVIYCAEGALAIVDGKAALKAGMNIPMDQMKISRKGVVLVETPEMQAPRK